MIRLASGWIEYTKKGLASQGEGLQDMKERLGPVLQITTTK
jgi:hypothetical protein